MSNDLARMLAQVDQSIEQTTELLARLGDLRDRIQHSMLNPIDMLDEAFREIGHARPALVVETVDEPTPEDKRELDEFYAQAALRILEGESE